MGVDENGMTTARKLYEYLEMDKSNYARWLKTYINDNQFAEENVDYFPFAINGECGGQASKDAKLTAKFAKKLSMMQKNQKGELAREYFTRLEEKAKETEIEIEAVQKKEELFMGYQYDYCRCESTNGITTGFEDDWGYWDVCCKCGKRIEDSHHFYNHYDGEDHDDIDVY